MSEKFDSRNLNNQDQIKKLTKGREIKLADLDPVIKARIEKRFAEFSYGEPEYGNFSIYGKRSPLIMEGALEIEKKLVIPPQDQEIVDQQVDLEKKIKDLSGEGSNISDPKIKEELEHDYKERSRLAKRRMKDFIISNRDIFYGVPQKMVNGIEDDSLTPYGGTESLGHLLSLPYHLQKMRRDGITHIVASATSSIPYCFLLTKLDRMLYSDQQPIKFLIFSTKTFGKGIEKQNRKFIEYFSKQKNMRVGVFDECASSDPRSTSNRRSTVTRIQTELERLSLEVIGRYGTDSTFPRIAPGKQITAKARLHGDEGKSRCLFWLSNLIEKDKFNEPDDLKIFDSIRDFSREEEIVSVGYERKIFGKQGVRVIKKLENLARIAFENFSNNSDQIWNPFNYKIRFASEYDGGYTV